MIDAPDVVAVRVRSFNDLGADIGQAVAVLATELDKVDWSAAESAAIYGQVVSGLERVIASVYQLRDEVRGTTRAMPDRT